MIRRPPRSTQSRSSAASDVYKRQQLQGDDISVDRGRAGARDRLRPLSRHNRLARARKGPGKRDDKGQELCANGHGEGGFARDRRALRGPVGGPAWSQRRKAKGEGMRIGLISDTHGDPAAWEKACLLYTSPSP